MAWLKQVQDAFAAAVSTALSSSKAYTDIQISKVRNKLSIVPSYQDLPTVGDPNTTYLVSHDGSALIYDIYAYENAEYAYKGTTELNLDGYTTDAELNSRVNPIEAITQNFVIEDGKLCVVIDDEENEGETTNEPVGLDSTLQELVEAVEAIANNVEEITEEKVNSDLPGLVDNYCEENFSEWQGALDASLTEPLMAAPADKVGELKSALTDIEDETNHEFDEIRTKVESDNIYNSDESTVGFLNSDGTVNTASTAYSTSDFIWLEKNTDYVFVSFTKSTETINNNRKCVALYDEEKTFVNNSYQNLSGVSSVSFNSGSARYARVCSETAYYQLYLRKGTELPDEYVSYSKVIYNDMSMRNKSISKKAIIEDILSAYDINLYDSTTDVDGYVNAIGTIDESTTYRTTDYIKVEAGVRYLISPTCRFIGFYDVNKTFTSRDATEHTESYSFVNASDGYIRVSYNKNSGYGLSIITQSSQGDVTLKVQEGIALSNTQISQVLDLMKKNVSSCLFGKNYVAAGDSYTAWSDAKYPTGEKYAGETVTYDREIRRLFSMNGSNIANSGSTIALSKTSDPIVDTMAFANTIYQSVPADTDYLTIAFGINDTALCNLGEKGDTTNETFWGAWDVVLKWFMNNRPQMKIGIIIFQRNNNSFYQAVIDIAKYYSIPYLDFYGGYDTPMYVDGKAHEVNTAYKTLRHDYFCGHEHLAEESETFEGVSVVTKIVEANTTHPGYRAHIDESKIIAEFLMSL